MEDVEEVCLPFLLVVRSETLTPCDHAPSSVKSRLRGSFLVLARFFIRSRSPALVGRPNNRYPVFKACAMFLGLLRTWNIAPHPIAIAIAIAPIRIIRHEQLACTSAPV
jgi:hypothetical protein